LDLGNPVEEVERSFRKRRSWEGRKRLEREGRDEKGRRQRSREENATRETERRPG
jgi:hypothetical protein